MKGYGFGLIGDIVVGVIGSFIGGWLFDRFGFFDGGLLRALIGSVFGAVLLLVAPRLVRRTA